MASPQKENGYTDIANEIVEQLAKLQLSGYESRILWAVFRKTYGYHKKEDWISLSQFQEMTNIGKETHISRAIKKLVDRKILTKNGHLISFNKDYQNWSNLPKLVRGMTKIGLKNDQNRGIQNQKPNITKPILSKDNRPSAINEELQEVIDFSKTKNFSLQGSQKINRQYAWNLMRKKDSNNVTLGKDRVKWLIEVAISVRGQPFAPQVNDFKSLYYKWQDLLNFKQKERNERGKNAIG